MPSPHFNFRRAFRTFFTFFPALTLLFIASNAAGEFSEDFEQAYFDDGPERYAKDHTIIVGPDGLFHIFYMPGRAGEGWVQAGNEVDFGHATSADLIHWTIHPRVLTIDPAHEWKSRNLWSPHVIRRSQAGDFLMAYAGVDSFINQAIGVAVSSDLFNWTDLSVTSPAYYPDTSWALWNGDGDFSHCRDPYVRELGGEIIMLTTAKIRPGYLQLPPLGAVSLARSPDGLTWLDDGAPLVINNSQSSMEYTHLTKNPVTGGWNLFYTRTVAPGGIHHLQSTSPTSGWDIASDVIFDPAAIASDIIEETNIYSSTLDFHNQDDLLTRSIRFDSLAWDGSGSPQIIRVDIFQDRWELVEGNIGLTLHDRPAHRTGQPSNMEGRFWVNTAENFSGPYAGGCPTCDADESRTGVLRSPPFVISGDQIELWVGGTQAGLAYVALKKFPGGQILRIARGGNSDVMARKVWDVALFASLQAVIEIVDQDPNGHVSVDLIRELLPTTGAGEAAAISSGLRLALGTEHPARGGTEFICDLDHPAAVTIAIYGPSGRMVRAIDGGELSAGRSRLRWDGRGADGLAAAPGVYFARLRSTGGSGSQATPAIKLVLTR